MQQDPDFVPSQPLRPKLWEDDWGSPGVPLRGLRECEARWGSTVGRNPQRTRTATDLALPTPAAQRQVRPRPLPQRRVFEVNDFTVPPLPARDAKGDVLNPPAPSHALAWSPVWKRLHDIELDRPHRVLAWRILHASVMCGALRLHLHLTDAQGAGCPHAECRAPLQHLSHLFVTCPVAAAVWQWVAGVWVAVAGGPAPPTSVAVLLADDARVWSPPPTLRPLWTRLRLAALHALWCASGKARAGLVHVDARCAAAAVMLSCKRMLLRHYYRIDRSPSAMGSCPHWLAGRSTVLTLHQFKDWWGPPGVLCLVREGAGGQRSLSVRWSATSPVPLPQASPQQSALHREQLPLPLGVDGDQDVDLGEEWGLGGIDTFA